MTDRKVSVDTNFAQVVKWDETGDRLFFEHEPGKFLELGDRELEQLSFHNRAAYVLSREMNRKAAKEEADPRFMAGAEVYDAVTAREQLHFDRPPGWDSKWHVAWRRPDEVQRITRQGYVRMTDEEVGTFNSGVGTTRTVGRQGQTELIAFKIPKEKFDALERKEREVSVMRARGVRMDEQFDKEVGRRALPQEIVDQEAGWRDLIPNDDEEA